MDFVGGKRIFKQVASEGMPKKATLIYFSKHNS